MIEIQNLNFSYRKHQPLFDQLSLDLSSGNIYGLLGKNGAGKSTLLRMIAGLQFPDDGEISVHGHRPAARNPHFLQEVYFIGEEFDLPEIRIGHYLRAYSAFYPRFDHGRFVAYTDEFQLDMHDKLTQVSYGQKKKFLLAFGLATDCRLLILDEPTNGLDIPSKSQFRKVVAGAITDQRSFIISTHQVRDMESLIDPIIILDQGQVVLNDRSERIASMLEVRKTKALSQDEKIIYATPTVDGFVIVRENTLGVEGSINLELLFNCVTNSREHIARIFKHATYAR